MKYVEGQDFFRIGRVRISVTNEDKAISSIKEVIHKKQKGYVCISTMRTVVIANEDDEYQDVMEHSILNTPDGTPLVWCGYWWGLKGVERACGPHIFPKMLNDKDSQLNHFFLGDTDETLSSLTEKARVEFGANVVGSYSPPFAPLDEYNIKGIAKIINDSGATIVWISLRAPKQDYLAAMLTPFLNDGIVMVGVGAAFRSVIGLLRQPDGILQKMGLAGLKFRRQGESRLQLVEWYFKHIIYLIKFFFLIHWKRIFGKNYWEQ